MGLDSLDSALSAIKEYPIGTALGATALGAGLGAGGVLIASSLKKSKKTKSKTKSRIKHTSRGWKLDRAKHSQEKWEIAYRRRKRRKYKSIRRKRVYYARKTGQPYIILANGKARFIKGKRRVKWR